MTPASGSSFWLDELRPAYVPRPPLEGDAEADVAVVGGGLAGTAAAGFLAARGARTILLERGEIAGGAAGRLLGLLPAGPPTAYAIAVKDHGRERARILGRLAAENHALLRRAMEEEGIDCGYARRGRYVMAPSDQEFRALEKSARLLAEDGFRAELLDDTAAARLFPGAGFRGGLFAPDDGEVHPARLARGLASAAERRGARIFERTRALRLEPAPDRVTIHTERGRVRAAMLLLAAGAETPLLHPFFEGALVGMRAQMLATEPVPERILPAPVTADFGFEHLRQLPDGRILASGGRRAAIDQELTRAERPTEPVQRAIESFLAACFPSAARRRVTHRWAAILGWSCDELPSVGPVPGSVNVYVAAGFHGHDPAFAAVAARAAADMILDGRTDLPVDLFSPRRHLPE
ncbi:MAG TPA: FAD-dependent oxidoreductase [Planctomycetota bacterium]|jgi:glycine/D-amino acid oxidase-like deaminating enzyme|nr:FAD-dependent oxidoreductase [Planctomycetota bacterium]